MLAHHALTPARLGFVAGDIHAGLDRLFGMRLFAGGISHSQYPAWLEWYTATQTDEG